MNTNQETMKYRIRMADVGNGKDFDVITEDGGIAEVSYEDKLSTIYYQSRLTEAENKEDVNRVLIESKSYYHEWEGNPSRHEIIEHALAWLVMGQTEWIRDDSIMTEYI